MLTAGPLEGEKLINVCRAYFLGGFVGLPWLWGVIWLYFRHYLEEEDSITGKVVPQSPPRAPQERNLTLLHPPSSMGAPACRLLPSEEEKDVQHSEHQSPMRRGDLGNTTPPLLATGLYGRSSCKKVLQTFMEEARVHEDEEDEREGVHPCFFSMSSDGAGERFFPSSSSASLIPPLPFSSYLKEDIRHECGLEDDTLLSADAVNTNLNKVELTPERRVNKYVEKEEESERHGEKKTEGEVRAGGDDGMTGTSSAAILEREKESERQLHLRWYVVTSRNLFFASIVLFIVVNIIFYLKLPPSSPLWGDEILISWVREHGGG